MEKRESIGDYYERKREAAAALWKQLHEHKATCPTCTTHRKCKVREQLEQEHERAAYTGD